MIFAARLQEPQLKAIGKPINVCSNRDINQTAPIILIIKNNSNSVHSDGFNTGIISGMSISRILPGKSLLYG
jgi:hypothetical protein